MLVSINWIKAYVDLDGCDIKGLINKFTRATAEVEDIQYTVSYTHLDVYKRQVEIPPMHSWETVVEMMYDKYLDAFSDEVVKVIYSKDRWMRYVVLKDEKEFFTYQLEAIYQYDEDEWKYICSHDNVLPAMWEPFRGIVGKSVFENIDAVSYTHLLR